MSVVAVGTVKERGDDYALMEFRADIEKGVMVSMVKINTARLMVNGRTVVNVKEGEDGSIYLLYKVKGEIRGVHIKAPKKAPENAVERVPESYHSEDRGLLIKGTLACRDLNVLLPIHMQIINVA